MKPNSPEKITTRYSVRVLWDRRTIEAVKYFVAKCTAQECQWFHFIDREKDEKTKTITYFISGMVIPEQVVSGATVETDGKGLLNAYNELKEIHGMMVRNAEGKLVRPVDGEGIPILPLDEDVMAFNVDCSRMGVWCHSHVKMKTDPSSTDNTQWDEWIQAKATGPEAVPVMMCIFNQDDEYFCRLYDPEFGTQINCPPFYPYDGFDFSEIDLALKEKIKKKVWTTTTPIFNYPSAGSRYQGSGTGFQSGSGTTTNSPKPEGTTVAGGTSSQTSSPTAVGGGTTSQMTKTTVDMVRGSLPSESVRSKGEPFIVTYVGGHKEEFLKLGAALNTRTGDFKSATEYCDLLNDYLQEDNVGFYIADQVIFGKDPNLIDLFAIDRNSREVQEHHKDARATLMDHLLNEDTESEFIFIIAAEIAFMYTFQHSMHNVAETLEQELKSYIGTRSVRETAEA